MNIISTIKKTIKNLIDPFKEAPASRSTENELPNIRHYPNLDNENTITHISAFTYGNAGDTLLPIALQDTWASGNPTITWNNQHVYNVVDENIVNKINRGKGLVIGGGGLFLKDTNANQISGWQWPCSVEMLHKIEVPVILYAVGYNRFRGQEEFEPFFRDNITAFAEKSWYIGIRNSGSIEALKNYIPVNLHHKLRYQPCMTTFLSELYSGLFDFDTKHDFIALNAAFDRSHLRFGEKIGDILSGTAKVLKVVSKDIPIKFYSHMQSDEAILPFLQSFGVKYEIVRLNNVHPNKIIEEYAKPKLVVGMRGHAQMIPFGCKTPIVSIVSHNKMQWFLDDIHQPDWGVDVLSESYEVDLKNRIQSSLSNTKSEIEFITQKQKELFDISLKNANEGLTAMNLK
jgi:polysaccharide pyruvyl transferase WcaK-like protein